VPNHSAFGKRNDSRVTLSSSRNAVSFSSRRAKLSVVAMCVNNPDCLPLRINRCDAAPTPTGFAEIVSDDFPELHVDRIVPLLVSTQQSQNDMKGRNDAGC
jgi:hypothetical protein